MHATSLEGQESQEYPDGREKPMWESGVKPCKLRKKLQVVFRYLEANLSALFMAA